MPIAEAAGRHSLMSAKRQWIFPAIFASFIIWGFGYQTVWQRLTIEIEGTIVSSRDVPATGASRYATYYVVRNIAGQEQEYVAGATDASLKRSLPVGTHIHKEWGQLGYGIDSQ